MDTKPSDKLARLETIIFHLETLRKELDTTSENCEHCGFTTKNNWREDQMHQQIGGMLTKLRQWRNWQLEEENKKDG